MMNRRAKDETEGDPWLAAVKTMNHQRCETFFTIASREKLQWTLNDCVRFFDRKTLRRREFSGSNWIIHTLFGVQGTEWLEFESLTFFRAAAPRSIIVSKVTFFRWLWVTTAKLRRRLLFSIFPERFEWTNKKSNDTRTCVSVVQSFEKEKKNLQRLRSLCLPCEWATTLPIKYETNFTIWGEFNVNISFRLLLLTSQLNFLTVFFFLSLNYTHVVLVSDVSTLVVAIVAWINESLIAFVLDAFFFEFIDSPVCATVFFFVPIERHTSYDQKSRHWRRRRLSIFLHFVKHPLDSSSSVVRCYRCSLHHTANFHMRNGTTTALKLVECTYCERNVERTSVSRDIHPSSIAWYEKLHVTISPSSLSSWCARYNTETTTQ